MCDQIDFPKRKAILLTNEARIYADLGRFDAAESAFASAVAIFEQLSDDGRLLHCQVASLFSKQRSGEIHLTQQWVELYEEAMRLEHAELQIRIQLFLAVHLFEQGNVDLAFRALDTTIRL